MERQRRRERDAVTVQMQWEIRKREEGKGWRKLRVKSWIGISLYLIRGSVSVLNHRNCKGLFTLNDFPRLVSLLNVRISKVISCIRRWHTGVVVSALLKNFRDVWFRQGNSFIQSLGKKSRYDSHMVSKLIDIVVDSARARAKIKKSITG